MAETPIARIARWFVQAREARAGVPESAPHQCMLGIHGHLPEGERCEVEVQPFSGYRRDGEVFCSEAHAFEAQGDRAI